MITSNYRQIRMIRLAFALVPLLVYPALAQQNGNQCLQGTLAEGLVTIDKEGVIARVAPPGYRQVDQRIDGPNDNKFLEYADRNQEWSLVQIPLANGNNRSTNIQIRFFLLEDKKHVSAQLTYFHRKSKCIINGVRFKMKIHENSSMNDYYELRSEPFGNNATVNVKTFQHGGIPYLQIKWPIERLDSSHFVFKLGSL